MLAESVSQERWEFDQLNNPDQEISKRVRDPVSTLITMILIKYLNEKKENPKLTLANQRIDIQKNSDYECRLPWIGKISVRKVIEPILRGREGDSRNDLDVLLLSVVKCGELFRPLNNDIRTIIEIAMGCIEEVKKIYNIQILNYALDRFKQTFDAVLANKITFEYQLSEAEERVRDMWLSELPMIRTTIQHMEEHYKTADISIEFKSVEAKIKQKQALFNVYCQQITETKLKTFKKKLPKDEVPAPLDDDETL